MARAPDQIIPGKGGIVAGLPVLAKQTAMAGAYVAGGFVAAEVGSVGLRTALGGVEGFASRSMGHSALVRGAIGTGVVVGVGLLLARGKGGRKKAAKIALLMELGVAASIAREYLQELIARINVQVATMATPRVAVTAGGSTLRLESGSTARAGGDEVYSRSRSRDL